MGKRKYTDNEVVISAFLLYPKNKDIVAATGLSKETVTRYKKDPEFQRILAERKVEYVRATVNKMQTHLSECVDVLMDIIRSEESAPQVKVNAINIMFSQCRDWTQSADVLEIIKNLREADCYE